MQLISPLGRSDCACCRAGRRLVRSAYTARCQQQCVSSGLVSIWMNGGSGSHSGSQRNTRLGWENETNNARNKEELLPRVSLCALLALSAHRNFFGFPWIFLFTLLSTAHPARPIQPSFHGGLESVEPKQHASEWSLLPVV